MTEPEAAIRGFLASRRSAVLATLSPEGFPHASYAPFTAVEECFYVLVSEAASHTANLLERPRCSLLFIEDENDASALFARRRVSLECEAFDIPRGDPRFDALAAAMRERLGETVSMLLGLADFHLVGFRPLRGEAVFGFGEAYTIEQPFGRIVPKRVGHRR